VATITVEDVPPGLLLRLAAAAAANGRCLNSEIIVHLARSANAPVSGAARTGWGGPAAEGAVRRERA
jgi:hypothetical protein